MLKASALYMVIVIALVIGVLCSAVIAVGYYYRSFYEQNFRYDQLRNNIGSGINLLIASGESYPVEIKISLFGNENDSLILKKSIWGIYDIGTVCSFMQKDSLKKSFTLAYNIDSTKWAAVYLIDEDRSVSVSGNTHIRGTVFIPKAGIREAYVNNQAYTGDKRIVIGKKLNSTKTLPLLLEERLKNLKAEWNSSPISDSSLIKNDSTAVSFFAPTRSFNFKKKSSTVHHLSLSGNIILFSDTTLTIDSTTHLKDVIVFAKGIIVKSGFRGNCQLFAADSIYIDKNCQFNYPSIIGIIGNDKKNNTLNKISINDYSVIKGGVFITDNKNSKLPPVICLGKAVKIMGQVYVPGLLNLKDDVHIFGSAFTNRFIYQQTYTRYENYLINLEIDQLKLSPYYISSDLFPVTAKKKTILQWLN